MDSAELLAMQRAELAGQRIAIQRETTNIIAQIVSSVAKLCAIPHSDSDVNPINLTVETLLEHIRILSLEATKEYGDGHNRENSADLRLGPGW